MRFLKIIKNLTIYFDDFLVATDDLETHLKTIQDVLSRARECNVKFNVSKFQFLKKEIKFLGHVFSELGCQLDSSRIEAIQKLTAPTITICVRYGKLCKRFCAKHGRFNSPVKNTFKKDHSLALV